MPNRDNEGNRNKEALPVDEGVKEAKTSEEATADCEDCGVAFMTKHKPDCPQAAMANQILENRKKQDTGVAPQKLSTHEGLDLIAAHLRFLGTILSASFLAQYNHENYILLVDQLKGAITIPEDQK